MGSLKWELADCSVAFSTMILMVSSDRKKISPNRNGRKNQRFILIMCMCVAMYLLVQVTLEASGVRSIWNWSCRHL